MFTLYQRRATGKSTQLVLMSHESGLPIAVASQAQAKHLQWLADKVLKIKIPTPFVASRVACLHAGKYLVDEASMVLQNLLGGEIVAMTIADEGSSEFDDYMDQYVLRSRSADGVMERNL